MRKGMAMFFSQLAKFLLHNIFWECELSLLYHEQRIKQDALYVSCIYTGLILK